MRQFSENAGLKIGENVFAVRPKTSSGMEDIENQPINQSLIGLGWVPDQDLLAVHNFLEAARMLIHWLRHIKQRTPIKTSPPRKWGITTLLSTFSIVIPELISQQYC